MKQEKPTYEQLESKLAETRSVIEAIENGQADAIVSKAHIMVLRLKEAEQALKESEQRYRSFVQRNPDAVFCNDTAGKFTDANSAAVELTGYTEKELLEMNWQELCAPEDFEKAMKAFQEALTGKFRSLHAALICKDGRKKSIYLTGGPEIAEGKIQGTFVIARDTTKIAEIEEELRVHQIELEMQNQQLRETQQKLEASRSKYTDLFDFAPVGYFVIDKKGNISEANLTGSQMVGIEREHLAGKPFALCVSKKDRDSFYLNRTLVFQTGTCKRCDLKMLRKESSEFTAELLLDPVTDAEDKVTHCRITVIDITRRKRAEQQSKNLAKFPAENPFPVLRLAEDGTILYSNKPGEALLEQWKRQIGQKAPKDWPKIVARALKSSRYLVKEINCGNRIFSCALAPVADGRYVNLYGRDVTKRKQTEEALRKSRNELEIRVKERTAELQRKTRDLDSFFSNTITPLVILDKNYNFIRVNKAYADACQRDISEFSGHNHFDFYPSDAKPIFDQVARTKRPYQTIARPFTFPDHPEWGITYWDWTLVPVLDDNGEVELLIFSLKDVTERKRAELALKESEEKYRSLVEFSPEAICVIVDEKVAFANTAALNLVKARNTDELIGKKMWDFIHPDSVEDIANDIKKLLVENEKVPTREAKIIRLDGSTVDIEASSTSVTHERKQALLVIFRDISERKLQENRKAATNSLL